MKFYSYVLLSKNFTAILGRLKLIKPPHVGRKKMQNCSAELVSSNCLVWLAYIMIADVEF